MEEDLMTENLGDQELDKHFALNKETYVKDFLPVYERLGVQPKCLVQFPIMLPFEIPFSSGTCTTYNLGDGNLCTLHFSEILKKEGIHAGIVTVEATTVEICKSRVEMTYVSGSDLTIPLENRLFSDIFDQLVESLNGVIIAYLVAKKDVDVYPVSSEMFEFGCIARVVPVEDWDKAWVGLFLTHLNVPHKKEKLSLEDHDEIIRYAGIIFSEANPFILSEELMLNARRNLKNGFYKEAVIYAQSSVETFLNALFTKILEIEGKSDVEIQELIEKIPFMGMVKKEFHTRIGGSWNPDVTSKLTGKWYVKTYLLRNRIAHGGYRPSFEEADDALKYAINFRGDVVKLIHSCKKKYPNLFQLVHIQK